MYDDYDNSMIMIRNYMKLKNAVNRNKFKT